MRDASSIRLSVNGTEYGDILSATLTRSLEQVVDVVRIEASDKWMQPGQTKALPFNKFDPAEFIVDGETVVTGYVASRPRGYTAKSAKSLAFDIKSRAGHVVDSSHVGTRTWRKVNVMRIMTDVFKPFGITISSTVLDLSEEFLRHGAGVGESAWSVAQRALRAHGLWAVSRPDGNVEIVEAGFLRYVTPLVGRGVPGIHPNIIDCDVPDDGSDLHDTIIVTGQSGRTADWFGEQAAYGWAKASDPSVGAYRPLVINETSVSKQKSLGYRADYEVKTRAGRARKVSCSVQSAYWDNELLEPNRRIQLIDPGVDVSGEFIIASAITTFGEGTMTQLELMPPEAFLRESPLPKAKQKPRDQDGKFVSWG